MPRRRRRRQPLRDPLVARRDARAQTLRLGFRLCRPRIRLRLCLSPPPDLVAQSLDQRALIGQLRLRRLRLAGPLREPSLQLANLIGQLRLRRLLIGQPNLQLANLRRVRRLRRLRGGARAVEQSAGVLGVCPRLRDHLRGGDLDGVRLLADGVHSSLQRADALLGFGSSRLGLSRLGLGVGRLGEGLERPGLGFGGANLRSLDGFRVVGGGGGWGVRALLRVLRLGDGVEGFGFSLGCPLFSSRSFRLSRGSLRLSRLSARR